MADLTKGNWTPYPQPPALLSDVEAARNEVLWWGKNLHPDLSRQSDGPPREAFRKDVAALEAAIVQREAAKYRERNAQLRSALLTICNDEDGPLTLRQAQQVAELALNAEAV